MTTTNKVCRKCGENKPLDDFYNMKTGSQGKDSYCIDCRKRINRQYERDNRRRRNEYFNKYYHEVIKPKRNK